MESFKDFVIKYRGAIIGGILGLLVLFTGFYMFIVWIMLIFVCAFVGNYIQQNKQEVKDRLKNFIDRF